MLHMFLLLLKLHLTLSAGVAHMLQDEPPEERKQKKHQLQVVLLLFYEPIIFRG